MKLTRQQLKAHERAVTLIHAHPPGTHANQQILCPCGGVTCEECDSDGYVNVAQYIFDHFQPGYCRDIARAANFFTPYQDARSVAHASGGRGRVLEPSAGIGALAHAVYLNNQWDRTDAARLQITCVELVEEFVAIGKLLLPSATWICGNVFDVLPTLGQFDSFVANPPFGKIPSNKASAWGDDIAFGIIEAVLPHCANGGVAVLPAGHTRQGTNPTARRGERQTSAKYDRFRKRNPAWDIEQTSWAPSNQWSGCSIQCDIVEVLRGVEHPADPEPAPAIARPRYSSTTVAAPADDVFALL